MQMSRHRESSVGLEVGAHSRVVLKYFRDDSDT